MGAPRRMCGDGRNAGTSGCGRAPAKSSKDGCPPHVQPSMVVAQQSCPRHRHSSNPRVLWSQNCNTPTPVAATDKATAPRAAQAGTHATTTTAVQRIHAHRQAASTTTITTSPPAQRQCSFCPDAKRFSMASAPSERPAMSQPQSSPALVDIQLLYVHTPRSYRAVDCTDDVEILPHHCGTKTSYACFAVGAPRDTRTSSEFVRVLTGGYYKPKTAGLVVRAQHGQPHCDTDWPNNNEPQAYFQLGR